HLYKENELLLPALVEADVDLAELLAGMHEILGGHDARTAADHAAGTAGHAGAGAAQGHHCTCGGHDDPGTPGATAEVVDGELDVRTLVPAQRHQQIFAAFDALAPATGF